jgi:hypothetical protein
MCEIYQRDTHHALHPAPSPAACPQSLEEALLRPPSQLSYRISPVPATSLLLTRVLRNVMSRM